MKIKKRITRITNRFDRGIWLVSLVNLLMAASFSICIPFLALYLHQDREIPMSIVGLIILASGLTSAVTELIGGELCDRLGRRPLVLMSVLSRSFVYVILALLVGYSAPVWSIAVAFITSQAIGAAGRPATQAMVIDLAPARHLTEAFGILRIGINVGWAAGPAIGGYLAGFMPYAWLFGFAAGLSIATAAVALGLKESIVQRNIKTDFTGLIKVSRNRSFMTFVLLNLFMFLAMGQMMSTLSIFMVDRVGFSTAEYGLLLTFNGIIVILFQYPIARNIDRFIKSHVLVMGCLLYSLGYLLFAWVGSYSLAVTAIIVVTFGEIIFAPSAMSIVGQIAPRGQKGRYMGFFGLNQIIGISLAPLFGGILLDIFPQNAFPVWGIIALIAALSALFFAWWLKNNKIS